MFLSTAAQCEIPPYRAIPFRDSIAEGVSHAICLVLKSIAQVSLRYPSCMGGIAPQVRMLGRGFRTQLSTPNSQIAIAVIFHRKGQTAGKSHRKSAIFARNSQNQIAIANDGNSHRERKRKTPHFLNAKDLNASPGPREASKTQEIIAMPFLNASVLPRKSLNHSLPWGFPLGNLLPKTRVLESCVLERKRKPNANASILGTLRFWKLRYLC